MGRIYDAMKVFFDKDEWPYEERESQSVLRVDFQGTDGNEWRCYAHAREAHDQFIFYSVAKMRTPEERRPAMAEFLSRANYGMIVGNFEMDFNDGEVRYKTSIGLLPGEELSEARTEQLVYTNVRTMDRYLKAIYAVAFGSVSPLEAVTQAEEGPAGEA